MRIITNNRPFVNTPLPAAPRLRIAGRRLRQWWAARPGWLRDGLTACLLGFLAWLWLVAAVLVF